MSEVQESLVALDALAGEPEGFYKSSDVTAQEVKNIMKCIFDHAKSTEPRELGPLDELYVEGFDSEQIWEEIQLQNEPLLKYSKRIVKQLSQTGEDEIVLAGNDSEEMGSLEEEEEEEEEEDSDDEEEEVEDDDEDEEVDGEGDEFDNEEFGEDGNEEDEDEEEEDDEESGNDGSDESRGKKGKRGRSHGLDEEDGVEDEGEKVTEDGFFDWDEMDKFAEEEEGEEDDNDNDNDKEDGEDDELNDEDMFGKAMEEDDEDDDEDAKNIKFDDFFGDGRGSKHKKKGLSQKQHHQPTGKKSAKRRWLEGSDDEEEEEEDDEEGGFGDLLEGGEGGGDEEDEEEDDEEEEGDGEGTTSLQRVLAKRKGREQALEEELVAKKEWHVGGEIRGEERGENTLLEQDLEFDRATNPAPVVTIETTAALEDIIKGRILEEKWDDVQRMVGSNELLARAAKGGSKDDKPELSQEKSKLGLGDVYAEEFEKATMGIQGEDKHAGLKAEIDTLSVSLFHSLNALSNFHFTPKPVAPQLSVAAVGGVAAIRMEEALPMGVSESAAAAPEEVYAKKHGREGVVVGEEERDRTEKKRLRRANKTARRKKRKAAGEEDKILAQSDPAVARKLQRAQMRKDLAAKNVISMGATAKAGIGHGSSVDERGAASGRNAGRQFTSSSAFFSRLQEGKSVAAPRRGGDKETHTSANGFKL